MAGAKDKGAGRKRPASGGAGGGGGGGGGKKPKAVGYKKPDGAKKPPFKKPFAKPGGEKKPVFKNHREQKEYIREKKAKTKKNFVLNEDIARAWEKARKEDPKTLPGLVKPIYEKVKGHACELACNHKGSRVLQAVLKYGEKDVRLAILEELEKKAVDLAKNSYGHFLVRKMFDMAPKEVLPRLIGLLRGHVVSLLRHPCGSAVVEEAFTAANKSQRSVMMSEFYSNEYKLATAAGAVAPTFEEVLARTTDRVSVMRHVYTAVTPILEKGMVDHEIVQSVLAQYVRQAGAQSMAELVEALAGPPIMRMVHTRDGMEVAVAVVRWGTAKHRKKVVKATKTHVGKMARDKYAHVVLMALCCCMDDTTLLAGSVLKEIKEELGDLAEDQYGSRVLLQLLRPGLPRYIPAPILALLAPRPAQGNPGGLAGDGEEVEGDEEDDEEGEGEEGEKEVSGAVLAMGTSKKEPEVRRGELLGGAHGIARPLAELCAKEAASLARSPPGADVLFEVTSGGAGGLAAQAAGKEATAAARAAVAALAKEGSGGGEEGGWEGHEHVMEHFVARRMMIRLLTTPEEGNPVGMAAAEVLWKEGLQGQCTRWVGSQYAPRVLAAAVESPNAAVAKAAAKELAPLVRPQKPEAWAAATKGGGAAGGGKEGKGPKGGNKAKAEAAPAGEKKGKKPRK